MPTSRRGPVWTLPLALLAGCAEPDRDDATDTAAEGGETTAPAEGDIEPLVPKGGSVLLGMHSPPWDALGDMQALMNGGKGWLFDVVYSTDFDWVGIGDRFNAAAKAGYNVMIRVDYARPDGTGFADASPTFGATVPPDGDVGHCLIRRGTDDKGVVVDKGPSRMVGGGEHLDCYLAYLDDLVARTPDVHMWVIGNEMNMKLEAKGFPGGEIDPAWYASVYKAARQRIRGIAGHAGDAVFLGGVSPGGAGDLNGPKYMSGNDYIAQMLKHVTPGEVGGIALHAYGGWPQVEHNGGAKAAELFAQAYREQLDLIDEAGFPCAPAIVTEFSVHTHIGDPNIYDEPHTAQFIADAAQGIHAWNSDANHHNLLGAVWFTWNDPWGFAEESLHPFFAKRDQAGQSAQNNPAMRYAEVAPQYPAGASGVPAKCKNPEQLPPPPPQGGECPCLDTFDGKPVDNVCFYAPAYAACQTLLGAAQCSDDAQWGKGWALHNDPNAPGYVCGGDEPPPPPPQGDCPCLESYDGQAVDNVCAYAPDYPACQTLIGAAQCSNDAQWGLGWHLHENPQHPQYLCGDAPPPPPPDGCPCLAEFDNFCAYGPAYPSCPMTAAGGYCDPDGDGSFADGDWGKGFSEYAGQCG